MSIIDGFLSPDTIIGSTTGGYWEWVGLSLLALITSTILLSALYMFATLFRNMNLVAYVKSELYEILLSAVLILFIFSLLGLLSSMTLEFFIPSSLVPPDPNNAGISLDATIYNASSDYFIAVDSDMTSWLNENYIMNIYMDSLASVTPYARPLGVGLVATPMAGFASPIKQLLYNMSGSLATALFINYAQLLVYLFSLEAFLNYYLPIGIFLRCFTPTRRLGGTIIGVAVAFLFIFPLLTTLSYIMFFNPTNGPMLTLYSETTAYFNAPSSSGYGFGNAFNNLYQNNFSSLLNPLNLLYSASSGLASMLQQFVGNVFLGALLIPLSVISLAFAVGFVMPIFNAFILVQAGKSLSKSFGDDTDISSLTRMI